MGYGFPPDFKTYSFGFEEIIYTIVMYAFPSAIIFTFLIKWGREYKKREKVSSCEKIKETSGFAILSFLLALLFVFVFSCWDCPDWLSIITPLLAIFFGIISLCDIKRKNFRGKPFAVLGIILGIWELSFVTLLLLSYYRLI